MRHNPSSTSGDLIRLRARDPGEVWAVIERAVSRGFESLDEDDRAVCQASGVSGRRHEPGYCVIRTGPPDGRLTPEQLDTIARILDTKAKGVAELTTSREILLPWVPAGEVRDALAQLQDAGASTLGAHGGSASDVLGCPVAGLGRGDLIDPEPQLRAVRDLILGHADSPTWLRAFDVSISGCRGWCDDPEIRGIALRATRRGTDSGATGFDLRIGGGLSAPPRLSLRLGVFIRPEEVVEVVRQITALRDDSRDPTMGTPPGELKTLLEAWGPARFRQVLEDRLGRRLEDGSPDVEVAPEGYRDHLGVHAQQQQGLYYVGVAVLAGRLSADATKRLADVCRRHGDGKTIRLTTRQNVLVPNVAESQLEKVLAALAAVGLSINAHPIRRGVLACAGVGLCEGAVTETKARARQVVEWLEQRVGFDEPLRLAISGGSCACAQVQIADIGLRGTKTMGDGLEVDAYDVLLGGRLGPAAGFSHLVLQGLPATACAARLEQLLLEFKAGRKGRESFTDWCTRVGDETLARILTAEQSHPLALHEEAPVLPAVAEDHRGR